MVDEKEIDEEEEFIRSLQEEAEKRAQEKKSVRAVETVSEDIPEFGLENVPVAEEMVPPAKGGSSDLDKLRFLNEVDEKMRKELVSTMRAHLYVVSKDVHDLVEALWTKTRCPVTPVEAHRRAMRAVVEELERLGVLYPEVTRKYPFDLYDALKDYISRLPEGVGKSRSAILRDIGRNHSIYMEAADYFLVRLCNEGYAKKRGKRYLKDV